MGEACFYHPDRLCLVSCVCVPVRVCDWCGVLCCMSRWVIGLLIFPLAEHKSLFYPASLNLSRVKCLCSQLLTGPPVCLFFFFFLLVLLMCDAKVLLHFCRKSKSKWLRQTLLYCFSYVQSWRHVCVTETLADASVVQSATWDADSKRGVLTKNNK